MSNVRIARDSSAEELTPLALAIHSICGLPITMRSRCCLGVRVEGGKVIDDHYTGPVLEEVLQKGTIVRKAPDEGVYKGIPVIVVPLKEGEETIAALGVVDITYGVYSEATLIGRRKPKP